MIFILLDSNIKEHSKRQLNKSPLRQRQLFPELLVFSRSPKLALLGSTLAAAHILCAASAQNCSAQRWRIPHQLLIHLPSPHHRWYLK